MRQPLEHSSPASVPARSGLLKGAAILGAAAVISKLLGTLQKIPLQNIAGDGVFGIYNAVYPLYILILTLATAGFPIAVSKFVSEYAAEGKLAETKRVLRTASLVLTATGFICFAALYLGADAIASSMGMGAAAPAVRSVSFALLIAPVMAALRGYFQGLHDMVPTAVSQVTEQTVRVACMITLLLLFTAWGYGPSAIAAGATFGSAAGAVGGLLTMLWFWRRAEKAHGNRLKQSADHQSAVGETAGSLIRRFIAYAVPICLGSIAMPVLTIVDAFTVPRLLVEQGFNETEAARAFGIYNHGLPLVQLVAMVATSMSAALVPSVAAAAARGERRLIRDRVGPILRFTWLTGLAASCGLAVAAVPINVMFFKSPEGWETMAILAFSALFSTLNIITAAILQGLGAVRTPAVNLFVAAAIKAAGNALLVPAWGIGGAAVAAVLAFAAAALLNALAVRKRVSLGLPLAQGLGRPLLAAACMCAAVLASEGVLTLAFRRLPHPMPYRLEQTAVALAAVGVGAAAYFLALLRLRAVEAADLRLIPGFERKIKPLLIKLRLLET